MSFAFNWSLGSNGVLTLGALSAEVAPFTPMAIGSGNTVNRVSLCAQASCEQTTVALNLFLLTLSLVVSVEDVAALMRHVLMNVGLIDAAVLGDSKSSDTRQIQDHRWEISVVHYTYVVSR